jgi:DNA anti-recombination protein RmuC
VKEMEEEKRDNFEKQKELLKEALKRANKKEKQEYNEINDKQNAIIERKQKIRSEFEKLSERNLNNEYPRTADTKYTLKSPEELIRMTSEESRLWSEQIDREIEENRRKTKDWTEKFDKWLAENSAINSRQMELIDESIEIILKMLALERKEKWLLLSIALRSQPNLLKYLQ